MEKRTCSLYHDVLCNKPIDGNFTSLVLYYRGEEPGIANTCRVLDCRPQFFVYLFGFYINSGEPQSYSCNSQKTFQLVFLIIYLIPSQVSL